MRLVHRAICILAAVAGHQRDDQIVRFQLHRLTASKWLTRKGRRSQRPETLAESEREFPVATAGGLILSLTRDRNLCTPLTLALISDPLSPAPMELNK